MQGKKSSCQMTAPLLKFSKNGHVLCSLYHCALWVDLGRVEGSALMDHATSIEEARAHEAQ
jgi:hypothetical protein